MTLIHSCPHDGAALVSVAEKSIRMESCHTCGGLWVPAAQLVPHISARASALLFQPGRGRETLRRCPVDGAAMRELDVGGVHIDRCESCRGLWFDAGELATVLAITGPANERKTEWNDLADGGIHSSAELVAEAAIHSGSLLDGAGDVLSAIAEFIGGAISF